MTLSLSLCNIIPLGNRGMGTGTEVAMTTEPNTPQTSDTPASDASDAPGSRPNLTTAKIRRQILSTDLLQGDREIQIVHGEEVYRLSLTRQGKLILHK